MRINEGDLAGSQVKINHDNAMLEVHARLMVVKSYRLPQDVAAFEVLSNKNFHSVEQWIIMVVLSLTVIGLLISIPMYFLAKKTRFTVRLKPKHGTPIMIEGNKEDWKELKLYMK